MVRNYKRKTPIKIRINLWRTMPDKMIECVEKVKNKVMTKKRAAEILGVKVSTFRRNMEDKNYGLGPLSGKKKVFTEEEEEMFVKNFYFLNGKGLPFTHFNLRIMVATILNRQNRTIPKFKDNIPGPEWAQKFVIRHKELQKLAVPYNKKFPPKPVESRIELIEKLLPVSVKDEHFIKPPVFIETNPTVQIEVPKVEEITTNSFILESDIKTEFENLIEESDTYYADDPLRIETEEKPLRQVPVNDVTQFHNYALASIEDGNNIKIEDFDNEVLQSQNLGKELHLGIKPSIMNEDDVSVAESTNDFRGFERAEKTTQAEMLFDNRSRLELRTALCIAECNNRVWKRKFECLQKRYESLVEKFQVYEKSVVILRGKKIVSHDAADRLLKVIPYSVRRKNCKSKSNSKSRR